MEVLKIKTKSNSKDTKDKITQLFFTEHLRPVDISKKLKVGMPYITKIIQKDSRYIEEKETRKLSNKEKNKIQKRMYAQKLKKKRQESYQIKKRIKFKNECMHKKKEKKKSKNIKDY